VALVAGGVRGLGLAVARELKQRGDVVHITYRSSEQRALQLEKEFPGRIHRVDLEDPLQADGLVSKVLGMDGRLDSAVHAVGDFEVGGALDEGLLERMLLSNLGTARNVAQAVMPGLRESKGALVFFGCAGLEGLGPRRDCAAYVAAKSALVVLMRSMALEEAGLGVRVNMVSPGLVPHDAAHAGTLDPELLAKIPMGRAGRPEEVAQAVAWLTSAGASYTTGVELPVAGGWML
jgi:NAD(P)-dependent dehydrogenase (short-subunit alcohol dehydrogenase family)